VRVSVIITAAGKSERFCGPLKKQFCVVKGKHVLARTLEAFEKSQKISEIIVVIGKKDFNYFNEHIQRKYHFSKIAQVIAGGEHRQDSVYQGLLGVAQDTEIVLIHDGVRPFVSIPIIEAVIDAAIEKGAALTAVPEIDTVVEYKDGKVQRAVKRDILWRVQTPQGFQYQLIKSAFEAAKKDGFYGTDDASLVSRLNHQVYIVQGSKLNLKITTEEDLLLAESICIIRKEQQGENRYWL